MSESVDDALAREPDTTSVPATDNALLAKSAFALLGCETSEDVFELIGDFLIALVPTALVIVNEATSDLSGLTVRVVRGVDDSLIARAVDAAGLNPLGHEFDLSDSRRSVLLRGVVTKVDGGLAGLLDDGPVGRLVGLADTLLGITECYSIGISDGEHALGNCYIMPRTADARIPGVLIESFIRHCFSALVGIERTTSLAKAAERDRLLLASMTEGLALHEIICDEQGRPRDYRFLDVNASFEAITGLSAQQVIGKTVLEVLPQTEPEWIERYGSVALSGNPMRFEDYSVELDRYFQVIAYSPQRGQFATLVQDITERRTADAALRLSEETLRTSEELLNRAQHYAHIGSWTWDIPTNNLQWSDEMFNLFGIDRATFTGSLPDVIAAAIHPDDREAVERANREVIEDHAPRPLDYRVVWPDGSVHVFWGEAGELIFDEDGRPLRLSGTVQDITERIQTQNALLDAVHNLERSNRDLEQFAYIASHDLQEPLRMVSMYTELLRKRYHGKLDADADDFIDYAVEGAIRMSQLLADLLDYSRVSTRGTQPRPVSAQTAMEQVLANLQNQIADTDARITVGDLPTVMADESQLLRVFQNLVSNSLKFHRDGVAPTISVTAEREGAEWRFCITDNGIGIAPEYFDQAFETFRRLHPRDSCPGTGIGLAICKRIVERLGGRIWVEDSTDSGTTFCFTLPAAS